VSRERLRRPGPLLLVLALLFFAPAADADPAANAARAAEDVRAATLEGDVVAIVDRMHPKLLELLGGRDAAIATMAEVFERNDIAIIDVEIGTPTGFYQAAGETVVFVPTKTIMRAGDQRILSLGYLAASRSSPDAPWVFVDGAGIDERRTLFYLFPGLPEDVEVPDKLVTPLE
jgi:hypothetical protein